MEPYDVLGWISKLLGNMGKPGPITCTQLMDGTWVVACDGLIFKGSDFPSAVEAAKSQILATESDRANAMVKDLQTRSTAILQALKELSNDTVVQVPAVPAQASSTG